MDIDDTAGLKHQLPDELISHALVEVADIDGRFLVLFPGHGVSWSSGLIAVCALGSTLNRIEAKSQEERDTTYQCFPPDAMFALVNECDAKEQCPVAFAGEVQQ